jgi:spermidine synthase
MVISLFSIGLISILGQVVLLRELNVSFYGVELIYLLALGVWLFWTAVGALLGRRTDFTSDKALALPFIIFGILLPLDIVFIRASRLLVGGVPGAYLTLPQQVTIAVISLLPAGILSGILFQFTAKSYVSKGKTAATAYAIESLGGLLGGLAATVFLIWGIQNLSIAFACTFVSVITPLAFLKPKRKSPLLWTAIVLAGAVLFLIWKASPIDHLMVAWNHPHLLASKDSPYGRITVAQAYGQISVFENDALAFDTEGTEAEYFTHLAALQHADPEQVLILGGGIEGIIGEMQKYKPKRIDYVELNPVMLDLVMRHLPDDIQKSLREPNVRITLADPRRFLTDSGRYDLILVGMPEPSSGQANRFYTKEFFGLCAAKLNPGGILAFRLRSAENIWTLPLTRRMVSICRALETVFPEILFLPGQTNVVTASREPLPQTPEIMSRRLLDRKISTRLVSPNYIRYLFTNDRFGEIRNLLRAETAPANTDVRPVCYQYALTIWLSKFFPGIALIDFSSLLDKAAARPALPLLLWISLPLLFLLSRFLPSCRRILLVAAAGFLGMVLETILILYYQVKYGVLYQDIGILLMSFMAGLALGAISIDRLMAKFANRPRLVRWYGVALLVGFCFLCVVTATRLTMSAATGLLSTSWLLMAAGFLVAGIFAYATLYEIKDQRIVISPLYAADLLGGSAGSLLGSLVLIPVLGLDITTQGMLLLAAFSILLV